MVGVCLMQPISIDPHTLRPLFRGPPLFLSPAPRINCNTSPGVPLGRPSQLHEGSTTDGVCECAVTRPPPFTNKHNQQRPLWAGDSQESLSQIWTTANYQQSN